MDAGWSWRGGQKDFLSSEIRLFTRSDSKMAAATGVRLSRLISHSRRQVACRSVAENMTRSGLAQVDHSLIAPPAFLRADGPAEQAAASLTPNHLRFARVKIAEAKAIYLARVTF
jgi:hypothetical protein